VGEVWVEEEGGVEADEAGDEDGVVEVDGAAEAGGGVDPGGSLVRGVVSVGDVCALTFWQHVMCVLQLFVLCNGLFGAV
jgi:hypothetical protein